MEQSQIDELEMILFLAGSGVPPKANDLAKARDLFASMRMHCDMLQTETERANEEARRWAQLYGDAQVPLLKLALEMATGSTEAAELMLIAAAKAAKRDRKE